MELTTVELLDQPLFASFASPASKPSRSSENAFDASRLLLARYLRDASGNSKRVPKQFVILWFIRAMQSESSTQFALATTDRYADLKSFSPAKPEELEGRIANPVRQKPLLTVHTLLRNLRRELLRELEFGPKSRDSLLVLSTIVAWCISDLKSAASLVDITEAIDTPLLKLRLLRRRLSGLTTKSVDHVLSIAEFDKSILDPFCEAIESDKFGASSACSDLRVPWRAELNTAARYIKFQKTSSIPIIHTAAEFRCELPDILLQLSNLTQGDKEVLSFSILKLFARFGRASREDVRLLLPMSTDVLDWGIDELVSEDYLASVRESTYEITESGRRKVRGQMRLSGFFDARLAYQ